MPDSEQMFGFLNIDKPLHMTSHDVVAKVRRKLGLRRVGHAGTLDPLASGVLVICVGRATRLSEYVMATTKVYDAQVRLGIVTTTYDAEGEVMRQADASMVTQQEIESVLPQFTGDIQQLPPMYSAVKQNGKKLYDIARQGGEVERKPRPVHIVSLDVTDWDLPDFSLQVTCGSGTYIRSLAYDIGEALNVGAHLSGLRRLQSGQFTIDRAVPLDEFLTSETSPQDYFVAAKDALSNYSQIELTSDNIENIRHGRSIENTDDTLQNLVMAYDTDEQLVAVLQKQGQFLKPQKVFL